MLWVTTNRIVGCVTIAHLCINRPIARKVMRVYWVMAKKTNSSNVIFVDSLRTAERISNNLILGGGWDYSYICLISGMLPETDMKIPGRRKAGEFSAWLCGEVMKRIYRFKYSRCKDDLHQYIKSFLEDHQESKLKRWIRDKISYSSLSERLLLEEQINLRDIRRLLIDEEAANV